MGFARALAALALVVASTGGVAQAQSHPVSPQPKQMAFTADDLGRGAVVESQRPTRNGAIAASRGYQRSFTGVTLGKAHLFTLQHTVLIGKTESDAAKLISSILLTASSKSGRDALYLQSEKSFAKSAHVAVRSGAVTRAGALEAGDAAAEIVFRFDTANGSFQVGEIFVRVNGNLSAIYYGAGKPGVTQAGARRLARVAAARMSEPGSST